MTLRDNVKHQTVKKKPGNCKQKEEKPKKSACSPSPTRKGKVTRKERAPSLPRQSSAACLTVAGGLWAPPPSASSRWRKHSRSRLSPPPARPPQLLRASRLRLAAGSGSSDAAALRKEDTAKAQSTEPARRHSYPHCTRSFLLDRFSSLRNDRSCCRSNATGKITDEDLVDCLQGVLEVLKRRIGNRQVAAKLVQANTKKEVPVDIPASSSDEETTSETYDSTSSSSTDYDESSPKDAVLATGTHSAKSVADVGSEEAETTQLAPLGSDTTESTDLAPPTKPPFAPPHPRLYVCPVCDKTFHWLCLLKRHIRIHSNSQIFKCPRCCFMTIYSAAMADHLLTHKDMKDVPVVCNICSQAFSTLRLLVRHIKSAHAYPPKQSRDLRCIGPKTSKVNASDIKHKTKIK